MWANRVQVADAMGGGRNCAEPLLLFMGWAIRYRRGLFFFLLSRAKWIGALLASWPCEIFDDGAWRVGTLLK